MIAIPQDDLDDLHDRLARTRWADDYANADWTYGVARGWLEEMIAYWLKEYDWRAVEAQMNAQPNYRITIDDIPLHFVYVRGTGTSPIPLVMTHGWPWTFWDMQSLVGPLSDPAAHGGDPVDAFDVIVPSLPGFGFSTPLRVAGINVARIAELWVTLVCDVLGYQRSLPTVVTGAPWLPPNSATPTPNVSTAPT